MHVILVRCQLPHSEGLRLAAELFCAGREPTLRLHRAAWSGDGDLASVYGRFAKRTPVTATQLAAMAKQWRALCPAAEQIDISRLLLMLDVPGKSHGSFAARHYVVKTEPEDGWAEEIARWYDTEHMPGLAAVRGCIHAQRFLNQDSGPRSLACYDLVSEEPLGSRPWLAVRGTGWSSRVRPHFSNTRRTMMTVMG